MSVKSEARLAILTRINRAVTGETPRLDRPAVESSTRPHDEIIEQFAEFAAEYRASVTRTTERDVPDVIRDRLTRRGSRRVIAPTDFPEELLPDQVDIMRDVELDRRALDAMESVVTTCAVAIAETGTVVLDHGVGQGRRALTLVPDHHVCVIRESQVVDSVPEAVARLQESVARGQPLTWISGPSATSDIELTRVEGVHGPRVLDLILVRDA